MRVKQEKSGDGQAGGARTIYLKNARVLYPCLSSPH